jgi:hypothetical protein
LIAYPAIFLACHRQHVRDDETGKTITEHQRAAEAMVPIPLTQWQ